MEWKLSPGDKGPAVRVMQALLNMRGGLSSPVPENGVFDADTAAAMTSFKLSRHLGGDGIYNEQTRTALVGKPLPREATNGWAAPWMDLALAEEAANIHEDSSPRIHNPRILEYHAETTGKAKTDEINWCSSFANWVMSKAGYRVDRSALANSWKNWGVPVPKGRYGAVTVLRSVDGYHVGFTVSVSDLTVRLLGGNQGRVGLGKVKLSNFPSSQYKIEAIRWPGPGDEPAQR